MLKEGGLAVSLDYDSAWTSAAMRECDKFCADDVASCSPPESTASTSAASRRPSTPTSASWPPGLKPGRESDDERIFSMNMGIAVDDMVTARVLYERALERGAGVRLPL